MRGAGIVLQEPSVVALTVNESRIVAVGEEAKAMLGRTPDALEVVRPMRDGVIADYQITEAMLRYFIRKAAGSMPLFKPKVMISVPFGVTSVESRAVHEAAVAAGGARLGGRPVRGHEGGERGRGCGAGRSRAQRARRAGRSTTR